MVSLEITDDFHSCLYIISQKYFINSHSFAQYMCRKLCFGSGAGGFDQGAPRAEGQRGAAQEVRGGGMEELEQRQQRE